MIPTPVLKRRHLLAAGGALALAAAPVPTFAATDAQIRRKINLAGRQRMLSQRMSKAAFFTALEVEASRHKSMMGEAHTLFDQTLSGLTSGDAELGLPGEQNEIVLESLHSVQRLWDVFGPLMAEVVARGGASESEISTIARMNTGLLFASDNVVKQLVSEYGSTTTELGLAISINVAGRQRMLSQKMAKETALIALGYDSQSNRATLRETTRLFDNSLTALIDGLPSISLPAPPDHIRLKLQEVKSIWADLKNICFEIEGGKEVDAFDLTAVASQTDPLLVTMNDAVTLYEQL
ncbi:MAG: type IV pili methyl-accepting chemotaxis transducer N-terminal domain-containing protein [Pseudomonadota bacterium]